MVNQIRRGVHGRQEHLPKLTTTNAHQRNAAGSSGPDPSTETQAHEGYVYEQKVILNQTTAFPVSPTNQAATGPPAGQSRPNYTRSILALASIRADIPAQARYSK